MKLQKRSWGYYITLNQDTKILKPRVILKIGDNWITSINEKWLDKMWINIRLRKKQDLPLGINNSLIITIFSSLRNDKEIESILSYLWSLSANFRSFEMLRHCRREWITGEHVPVITILVTVPVCFAQYRTITMPMKFGKRAQATC